jgi:pimeloyl-ACP methyl ester carboxylesterase
MLEKTRLIAAGVWLVLSSCSPPAATDEPDFQSDRITVEARGTGEADIILVPGLASHRDTWAGVADSLADEYRLHLVQLKGFAGLPPEANATGPVSAPVAEEIARYIREAGLRQPAIVGHSMGGSIAMMVAARHPDLVGRLMVVDMPPSLPEMIAPGATDSALQRIADDYHAQILADTTGSPDGVLEQLFLGMTRVDSLKPLLLEGVRGTHRPTAANAMHELMMLDLTPELGRIRVPVSVLYVVSPETPPGIEDAYRNSFATVPNARIVRIDDANHFIHFDQPGHFVAEVRTLMRAPAAR